MRSIQKYFHYKWSDSHDKWYPTIAYFFLTNECDFKCPYCHSGPFLMNGYERRNEIISGDKVISLLKIIRQHTDYLVITGGEPLNHPDFEYIMKRIGQLKFKSVFLGSNGYHVKKNVDLIVSSVDNLIISLDSMNPEKSNSYSGIVGAFERVVSNLETLKKYQGRKFRITISSVITPDNIDDLYDVYWFTKERQFEFAAAPQLFGLTALKELKSSERYFQFFNFLIHEKSKGGYIYGTKQYLRNLQKLNFFKCYPFTMLTVTPIGDVYYPCSEGGEVIGNLFEESNLHNLRREGELKTGIKLPCEKDCHSPCMLGFSLAIQNPGTIISEVALQIKRVVENRFNSILKNKAKSFRE